MAESRLTKRRWSTALKDKSDPLKMAEPMHRKPPPGATTGQSIRRYQAKSPLLQVKEICLYYVKKCSGKYEDNKAAARYVHHMAEEIVSQLSGVAGEIKRNKGEPELYQALLDEWNENFPPSLGAMGSPKAIAALVAQQSAEIADLRQSLQSERGRREKEVSDILRSMDAQLHAYKGSVMSERRHQQLLDFQKKTEQDSALQELRNQHERELSRLTQAHSEDSRQAAGVAEQRLQDALDTIQELQRQQESAAQNAQRDLERLAAAKDRKYEKLQEKFRTLRGEYNTLVESLHEDFSLLSTSSYDETEFDGGNGDGDADDDSCLGGKDGTSGVLSPQKLQQDKQQEKERVRDLRRQQREAEERRRQQQKQDLLEKIRCSEIGCDAEELTGHGQLGQGQGHGQRTGAAQGSVNGGTASSGAGSTGVKLKKLREEVEVLRKENKDSRVSIAELLTLSEKLSTENEQYKRRYHELERLHESLRRGLSVQLTEQQGVVTSTASVRQVRAKTDLLCHTPHFLGPADTSGLLSNGKPKISAYNHPGYF